MARMGIKVTGSQSNLASIITSINKLAVEDRRKAMKEAGRFVVDRIRQNMQGGRDPYGRFWKKSWRAKLNGGKTMIQYGNLLKGWSYVVTGKKPGTGFNIFIKNPESAKSKRYAYVHNEGRIIRKRNKSRSSGGEYMVFPLWRPDGPIWAAKKVVIPKRQMIPVGTEVPTSWVTGIRKAILANLGVKLPK